MPTPRTASQCPDISMGTAGDLTRHSLSSRSLALSPLSPCRKRRSFHPRPPPLRASVSGGSGKWDRWVEVSRDPRAEVPAEPHPGPSLTAGQGTGASVPRRRRGERDQAPGVLVSVRPANPESTDRAVYKLPTFISVWGCKPSSRGPPGPAPCGRLRQRAGGREQGRGDVQPSHP